MKKLLMLFLFACNAQAHVGTPDYDSPPPPSCYTIAARESWGAWAQMRGAPQVIMGVPHEILRQYFFDEPPTDGIYVSIDLDADDLKTYVRHITAGYEWAKTQARVDRDMLLAMRIEANCGK